MARLMIMVMDAWTFIPFMMIMLLAGLQAIPKELIEAAKVDGATGWKLLGDHLPADAAGVDHRDPDPHHLQAEARRHHHQRHLGRPGRRDRQRDQLHLPRIPRPVERRLRHACWPWFYLVLIVIFMTILMKLADRWMRPSTEMEWTMTTHPRRARSSATARGRPRLPREVVARRVAIYGC
jgi:multiple sugar transport system permease protein